MRVREGEKSGKELGTVSKNETVAGKLTQLMNALIHFDHSFIWRARAREMGKEKGKGKGKEKEMHYYLLKTEASEWSWEDQAANGGISKWDGVKNKQAQNYLKSMSPGDLCFFYHSGAKARRVVGVVTVIRHWYDDDEGGAVDVKAVGEMRRPVDLKDMKGDPELKGFTLFRQPRLSVVPVSHQIWNKICALGGGYHGDGLE